MSPQQVADATNGEAPVTGAGKSGKASKGKAPGNKGRFVWDSDTLTTEYFYDETGLVLISARPKGRVTLESCGRILTRIESLLGPPTSVSDQIILQVISWDAPTAANRMSVMASVDAGICKVSISRPTVAVLVTDSPVADAASKPVGE